MVSRGAALARASRLKQALFSAAAAQTGIVGPRLFFVKRGLPGQAVEEHLGANNKQILLLLEAGRFEPVTSKDAARGIRGQKADATRDETRRLQTEGLSKADIARQLGVTVRTVERYWVKPVTQK